MAEQPQQTTPPGGDMDAWTKVFEKLPTATQEKMREWFAGQILIVEALGIPEEQWLQLVYWALENPLDFSFLEEVAQEEARGEKKTESARKLVGADAKKNVATGPGISEKAKGGGLEKELYQQFMAQRMNETAGRRLPKKKGAPRSRGTPSKGRK